MREEPYHNIMADLLTGDLILGAGAGHAEVPLGVVIRAEDIAPADDLGHPLLITPQHRVRLLADVCRDLDVSMVRVVIPTTSEARVDIADIASLVLDGQDPSDDGPLLGPVRVHMAAHRPRPTAAFTVDRFESIFEAAGPVRALMRMNCPFDGNPELCPVHSGRRR